MANDYTNVLKQINVDKPYWLDAAHLLDQNGGQHTYEDIASLIAKGLEIKVLNELPEIPTSAADKEAFWKTWSGKLILIPEEDVKSGTYIEYVLVNTASEGYTLVWEKIGTTAADLSDYAKKIEAGKAGTYTSSAASSETTGTEEAYAATVTVSNIKYDKAAAATGSEGAGEAANTELAGGVTISGSNFTFAGKNQSITVGVNKVTGVSVDDHSYTPSGDVTVSHDATKDTKESAIKGFNAPTEAVNINTTNASKKGIKLNTTACGASEKGTVGIEGGSITPATAIDVVTGVTAAGLSSATTSSTGAVKYTEDITGSAPVLGGQVDVPTNAIKKVELSASATSTDGPEYIQSVVLPTMTAISFTKNTLQQLTSKNYGFAGSTNNVMYSPVVNNSVLSWSTVNAGTQDVLSAGAQANLTGGVFTDGSKVTKYMKATSTAADTAKVTISGGVYEATIKYLKATGGVASATKSVVPSYTHTPAALTGTTTFITAALKSAALAEDTDANPTFAFNTDAIKSATCGQSFVTGVTSTGSVNAITAIGGLTAEFDGNPETFTHTVTDATYSGSFNNNLIEGTIGGSQVVANHSHSYVKPIAHTHTIGSTSVSVTGSATAAILAHSHEMGHTHTVIVPAVA